MVLPLVPKEVANLRGDPNTFHYGDGKIIVHGVKSLRVVESYIEHTHDRRILDASSKEDPEHSDLRCPHSAAERGIAQEIPEDE